jgi:hypothetical protein
VVKDREKLNPKSKRFIFVGCGNHVKSTTYACDPVSLNILRERERGIEHKYKPSNKLTN